MGDGLVKKQFEILQDGEVVGYEGGRLKAIEFAEDLAEDSTVKVIDRKTGDSVYSKGRRRVTGNGGAKKKQAGGRKASEDSRAAEAKRRGITRYQLDKERRGKDSS